MTAHDTLRWGETHTFKVAGTVGEFFVGTSGQILSAHWRWPLSWNVLFLVAPQIAAAETAGLELTFAITVGIGQATATYTLVYDLAAGTTPPYAAVVDQRFIPAQDLQVICRVTSGALTSGQPQSLGVSCFAAPQTEPHAMTELLERASGKRPEEVQWMPPGFTPEEMGYRR